MKVKKNTMLLPIRLSLPLAILAALSSQGALALDAPVTKVGAPIEVAAQDGTDVWSSENRVKKGADRLQRIYAAAGGLEEWAKIKGIRFDMLETWRIPSQDTFKVHHRTAMLCWYTRTGDGFVRTEHVLSDGVTPGYRREVTVGNYSWVESASDYNRDPKIAGPARAHVGRLFFLSCMPFSLQEHGAEMVFLKKIGSTGKALYGMRLAKPVMLAAEEEQVEFGVVVDTKTNKILQIQYSLYDEDKFTLDESTECVVDFEGEKTLSGVKLYNKHFWSYEIKTQIQEFWAEDFVDAVPPGPALRKPWQSGEVLETDLRADHWDPPAREPEQAPEVKDTDKEE